MKDKKQKSARKRKIHNYILLVFLFLCCMAFVLYLCELYKVNEAEKKKTPVIRGSLLEIYQEDLEHYVLDNPNTLIYLCTSDNDTCRSFEKSFKKFLNKKEFYDQIIYLNLTDLNQEEFVNQFNSKYHYKVSLSTDYPAFVLFEDGKVISILQGSEKKPLTITKLRQFLELNEIGE